MPRPEQELAPGRGWMSPERGPSAAAHVTPAENIPDPERERLLAEERARIGCQLHDPVIRRLFAVSLKLSGALAMIEHKEAGRRVDEAIADLDQTVKLIRSVVFALERGSLPHGPPAAGTTAG